MPRSTLASPLILVFQSAPAIAGGRCGATLSQASCWVCFNPRPPLLAGDARSHAGHDAQRPVSIRARHCWRAMPQGVRPRRYSHGSFNPRPPLLAGDATADCTSGSSGACFNPRPPLLAGDAVPGRRADIPQSCFNPRPPLLAGDAHVGKHVSSYQLVSIRARHCWRAMPESEFFNPSILLFQSAPAIAGGRCSRGRYHARCHPRFNPRPPLLAGDAVVSRL